MGINAVITGDLVKSRRIKEADIAPVIKSLKDTFKEIKQQLLKGNGTFEIFRGDSFQGVIPMPELALLISIIIRARLRTYEPSFSIAGNSKKDRPILYSYSDARIAIGIGSISHKANRIAESQGEAFEKSGHAFDAMQKNNERIAIVTPWENTNSELEVECKLADAIISRWTASTAEAMYHHLLYSKNQKELASLFDITQPGVHKRLTVYGNVNSIHALMNRYQDLIIKAK
jgi:hypothetical protein